MLPHKEPLIFAKKAISRDANGALVEIDFGFAPTLAMTIEAAAQAFSYVDIKSGGTFGVIAMVKNAAMQVEANDMRYFCKVSVTQAMEPYYQLSYEMLTNDMKLTASGELSIKIF